MSCDDRARKRMPSYRPWGSTDDGAIEFESLTDETLEGALNVLRKSFFYRENICKCVDLMAEAGASNELEELCLDTARDGVSVVAIDVASGEVVGVAFNKIQLQSNCNEKTYFERFSERCKYESSKHLIDVMVNLDARVDLFKHYNVDCILEIMFLSTLVSHGQRRIGELLVSSSLELTKELKRGKAVKIALMLNKENAVVENAQAVPSLVSALMTSNYSQKIATKLGFERVIEVTYDEFQFKGKKFCERIGKEHKSCVLVVKRVVA